MAIKDKYKIERKYVTNRLARGGAKISKVRYLVAHETANNSADADAHYRFFQGITYSASAHTFIDDKKILEIIPVDEKAWHVQYGQDRRTLGLGYANDYAIGTELCRTGKFREAYDRFVWYHAYLCKKFGLNPLQHITAHKFEDPQRRSDPQSWLEPNGVTWFQFIRDVKKYYDAWDGNNSKPITVKPAPNKVASVIVKNPNPTTKPKSSGSIVDYLNSIGVNSSMDNRKKLAAQHGIKGYSGTAAQNLELLDKIKNGVKPAQSKPKTPTSKTLYLPKTASSWRVYPTNKAPVKGNEKGFLNPKKFGGLSYKILGNPQKDVYTIQTANFGKVNIYAAPSTGATIK